MKYLVDSSVWIDYLEGNSKGEKFTNFLEDSELYALPLNIAEVVSKVKRKKGNFEIAYSSIVSNAQIFEVTPRMAKEAGLLHAQIKGEIPNFSLADAIVIVAAKTISAKILTTDEHFKRFKEAVLL